MAFGLLTTAQPPGCVVVWWAGGLAGGILETLQPGLLGRVVGRQGRGARGGAGRRSHTWPGMGGAQCSNAQSVTSIRLKCQARDNQEQGSGYFPILSTYSGHSVHPPSAQPKNKHQICRHCCSPLKLNRGDIQIILFCAITLNGLFVPADRSSCPL